MYIRAVAEVLGRTPPASRYSPDMSKHAYLGDDPAIPEAYQRFGRGESGRRTANSAAAHDRRRSKLSQRRRGG